MHDDLAAALAGLEERKSRLLAELSELTPEQLRFRREPGSWSLTEVAHHLLLVESASLVSLEKRSGKRRRRTLKERLLYPVVRAVIAAGVRVRAPTRRVLPDPEIELQRVAEEWEGVRERLTHALAAVEEAELGNEALRHPIAGPLDYREGLAFLSSHFDHHLPQVRRIREAPGFPSGPAVGERSPS